MPDVIKSIGTGRDYSLVSLWLADLGNSSTYPDADTHAIGEVYGEVQESGTVAFAGADQGNVIKATLRAAAGEKHTGLAGSGARVVSVGSGATGDDGFFSLNIYDNANTLSFVVEDLEFDANGQSKYWRSGVYVRAWGSARDDSIVRRCLVYNQRTIYTAGSQGHIVSYNSFNTGAGHQSIVLANNFVFTGGADHSARANGLHEFRANSDVSGRWANNSVYGITQEGSGDAAAFYAVTNATVELENNVGVGTTAGGSAADYLLPTNQGSSLTNASGDSTAPAAIAADPVVAANEFENIVGPIDLHLKAGAECIDAGSDLGTTYELNIDIDGDTRSAPWDVGGDEAAAGPIVRPLEGTSTVQHDAQGTLTVIAAPTVKPLEGTSTVQHDVMGTMTLVPGAVLPLQGTATVEHGGTATATIQPPEVQPLVGTSTVQHDARGTMRIPVPGVQPLRGTSTVEHDATATLRKIRGLSGSSDVLHDARGTLTVLGGVQRLQGTAGGQHDAQGTLIVPIRRLLGITTVQHDARGTISGATTPAADGQAWTAPHTSAEWHAPQTSAIWTF